MTYRPSHPESIALKLRPQERWTLHHVLLDRIDRETITNAPSAIDPPPLEVFQAFEALDAGESEFTALQLEGIETVISEYRDSEECSVEESDALEAVGDRIETALESERVDRTTDPMGSSR